MSRDILEKSVFLRAPIERVWRAISDSREFGLWFGASFDAPFTVGETLVAKVAPTTVDDTVASLQKPHEGKLFSVSVEQIEPMRLFSFRWHPVAADPGAGQGAESTTLVAFELFETGGSVLLAITESGFEAIPEDRRAAALAANEAGWSAQVKLIEKYVAVEPG